MNTKNKIQPYIHHAKYYETDQMGIIHHSNYIRWMEDARMDAMSQFGISYNNMEKTVLLVQLSRYLVSIKAWRILMIQY